MGAKSMNPHLETVMPSVLKMKRNDVSILKSQDNRSRIALYLKIVPRMWGGILHGNENTCQLYIENCYITKITSKRTKKNPSTIAKDITAQSQTSFHRPINVGFHPTSSRSFPCNRNNILATPVARGNMKIIQQKLISLHSMAMRHISTKSDQRNYSGLCCMQRYPIRNEAKCVSSFPNSLGDVNNSSRKHIPHLRATRNRNTIQ